MGRLDKNTAQSFYYINKLFVDVKPVSDPEARIIDVPRLGRKSYLITDDHRDSPAGFGVKTGDTEKICVIQRRAGVGRRTAVKHYGKLSEPRREMYLILPISFAHAKRPAALPGR
ncbi:hypothetical protein VSX61_03185 [Brenneria populi subsp. brevivirga]|uniref:hypothetical protein n=1 Tax=Brenneria populi TaxID=1505588 RepID=UPI002E175174|nr:hypothetical protein [Brenneria populi subsp. brevivirga]